MKKLLLLAIFAPFLFSCENYSVRLKTGNTPDTVGYYAARDLKGLANFKIGESTYSKTLESIKNEIHEEHNKGVWHGTGYPKYVAYSNGYYGFVLDVIRHDTTVKFFDNSRYKPNYESDIIFGCPNFKTIRLSNYFIGDINLQNFQLKFFRDTLYEISCNQNNDIEIGFEKKYGKGKYIQDKAIVWENEDVKAEARTYKGNYGSYSSAFTIETKNDRIKKEIIGCKNAAYYAGKRIEESRKNKDIDKL